jgi:diaminopimelate epimerase
MKLRFTKMQGAGNDFVVLDGVRQVLALSSAQVRWLADRHFGIGADQVLLVEPASDPGVDFRYRIFNADGDEVEHCGNGARCFVRFVREQGLSARDPIRVQTLAGVLELSLGVDGQVSVDMGAPIFDAERVPFDPAGLTSRSVGADSQWPIELDHEFRWASVLSMGNPHAVLQVDDLDHAPVTTEGPRIEHHRRFARRVNVGFMQVTGPQSIALRVWERGAGETLACGTGACAAAVSAIRQERVSSPVRVRMRGGEVTIAWQPGQTVRMTGPAETVFEGEVALPEGASAGQSSFPPSRPVKRSLPPNE